MKKLSNVQDYPQQRAMQLLEALSRDLTAQIIKIFKGQHIMFTKYSEFSVTVQRANELF